MATPEEPADEQHFGYVGEVGRATGLGWYQDLFQRVDEVSPAGLSAAPAGPRLRPQRPGDGALFRA